MMDLRRNQLAEFVEKEFIGPDPIDFEGYKQENGLKKVKWKTLIYWKWKMMVKYYLNQQEIQQNT